MSEELKQLAAGGLLAYLLIKEILAFLQKKKGNGEEPSNYLYVMRKQIEILERIEEAANKQREATIGIQYILAEIKSEVSTNHSNIRLLKEKLQEMITTLIHKASGHM